jgi:hypothetical protein
MTRRLLPIGVAAAILAPFPARPAPEPWPDRARATAAERVRMMEDARPEEAASLDEGGAAPGPEKRALEVVPASHTAAPRAPSLVDAILALPVVAEHRDDEGRLVRLARDPSGATIRYTIGPDGRIAELEVWPAARR